MVLLRLVVRATGTPAANIYLSLGVHSILVGTLENGGRGAPYAECGYALECSSFSWFALDAKRVVTDFPDYDRAETQTSVALNAAREKRTPSQSIKVLIKKTQPLQLIS